MKSINASARSGFTIVELLIVVVVIAILAAITIVAYTNFQNRAHDSVVEHDLTNFTKKVQLMMAETSSYPAGGATQQTDGGSFTGTVSGSPQPTVDFTVSKSSYPEMTSSGAANFIYCAGPNSSSGSPEFSIVARSKSGKVFRSSSSRGLETISTGFTQGVGVVDCVGSTIGFPRTISYGYFTNASGWQAWAVN